MKTATLILGAALLSVDDEPPRAVSLVRLEGDGVLTWVRGQEKGQCFLDRAELNFSGLNIDCKSQPPADRPVLLIETDRLFIEGFES